MILAVCKLGSIVLLITTLSMPAWAQDLWRDSGASFSTEPTLPVGSVIVVAFDNDLELDYQLELAKTRAGAAVAQLPPFEFLRPLLGIAGDAAADTERTLKLRSRERTRGSMGAVITGYDAVSRSYALTMVRQMQFNTRDVEQFSLTATVNAEHISAALSVSAGQLANVNIRYDSVEQGITLTAADFVELLFPSRAEIAAAEQARAAAKAAQARNAAEAAAAAAVDPAAALAETPELLSELPTIPTLSAELSAEKKREIFLYLLQQLLNDWF